MDKPVTPIKTDIKMIQYAAGCEYTREAYCDERFVFESVSHIDGETTAFSPAYCDEIHIGNTEFIEINMGMQETDFEFGFDKGSAKTKAETSSSRRERLYTIKNFKLNDGLR